MSQQSDYLQGLLDYRDELLAAKRAVLAGSPPIDYSIDGQSVTRSAYLNWLKGELKDTNDEIYRAQGPKMVKSIGRG